MAALSSVLLLPDPSVAAAVAAVPPTAGFPTVRGALADAGNGATHGVSLCALKHGTEQYRSKQVGHLYLDTASMHTPHLVAVAGAAGAALPRPLPLRPPPLPPRFPAPPPPPRFPPPLPPLPPPPRPLRPRPVSSRARRCIKWGGIGREEGSGSVLRHVPINDGARCLHTHTHTHRSPPPPCARLGSGPSPVDIVRSVQPHRHHHTSGSTRTATVRASNEI